ncbi:MAG: PDZ domain-containing protein, partial [Dysgonomonas sp.]
MKKKLFPIVIGLISIFFITSCESEEPFSKSSPSEVINTWLYDDIFGPNYLWGISASPNKSLEPDAFFNSLKNSNDKVSEIWTNAEVSATYDIGFEYAANRYDDGKIYYVIYYVKPQSSAEAQGLKRGYIITAVNEQEIQSEADAETRLSNAYKSGADVKLTYVIPPASDPKTVTVAPK